MLKLQLKDKPSRSYWLVGEQLTLGTGADCNVVLEGLGINELHAKVVLEAESITLEPQPGCVCHLNNEIVNGPHPLHEGDEIRIAGERVLVIDPKMKAQQQDVEPKSTPQTPVVWSLTAEHPKLKGRPFLITGKSVLGRSKEVGLFIPFKHLSREHAELTVSGDVLKLKDLGSSNGCFVNGERVKEYDLKGGEAVSFAFLDFVVNSPVTTQETVSMDVTMVRSAITAEDIEQAQREQKTYTKSLDLSEIDERYDNHEPQRGQPKYWLWAAVIIPVLAALVYGAWQQLL